MHHSDDALSALRSMNPSSKEDWESFSTALYTELIKKQSSKPGYEKHFVPHFLKLVCSNIRDVEVRKASTMLKTYAEEKTKAEKEAKKTGGQKKVAKPKTVGTASAKNVIDTKAYGDEALDDDLDFM
ncbi:translation initiation factor eIF3 subunit [Testicularia cyperi]|uniref:Eukaryotic translation initiation factor 3 30 kDa subunit n=1 Tax=Testicularia cyperi TaxID=1882483 RepID=A0A317XMY8_9BASI|nr:translation initiation factor eIF3 subunit [Testicularia cyperi]